MGNCAFVQARLEYARIIEFGKIKAAPDPNGRGAVFNAVLAFY